MIVIDEKFKKEIGKRLTNLRKQYNFTISTLVEKLNNEFFINIDEKTIRRYEKGEFLPKIDNLIAFSELFKTSLDYIVYGKETSDDNSFTWKDSFKRINRLLFSCVLFPWKDENPNSKYHDKYFFTGYDEELKLYIDRIMNFVREKNYFFEVRDKNPVFDIHDLDNLIQGFNEYTEQLIPSKKRLDDILIKTGENTEDYMKEKLITIKNKRKTQI